MALLSALGDTYRRYKKGTESCVQWLATAARSTGAVGDIFTSEYLPQKTTCGGRPKEKARTKPSAAGLSAKPAVYKVPTKAFVRLAKAIVGNSTIEIPRSVLATLRAVIRGRKDCATWYLMNQNGTNELFSNNNLVISILSRC